MPEEDELERLREKKKQELQREGSEQQEAMERQRQEIWQKAKSYMSEEAKERLSNIKTVDKQKAYSVAQQIVALGNSGRINEVDNKQMKQILREIQKDKEENETNIKFRK